MSGYSFQMTKPSAPTRAPIHDNNVLAKGTSCAPSKPSDRATVPTTTIATPAAAAAAAAPVIPAKTGVKKYKKITLAEYLSSRRVKQARADDGERVGHTPRAADESGGKVSEAPSSVGAVSFTSSVSSSASQTDHASTHRAPALAEYASGEARKAAPHEPFPSHASPSPRP